MSAIKFVDEKSLKNNIMVIKNFANKSKVCAVLKANAYGHGIKNTAKAIEKFVDYFAVINIDEAKILRKFTQKPIVCIGKIDEKNLNDAIKNDIEISVFCKKDAQKIEKKLKNTSKNVKLHIKIDSGMHRLGVNNLFEFCEILNIISQNKQMTLTGIFTHIGSGKCKRTTNQLNKFKEFCSFLKQDVLVHYANSDTTFFYPPKQNEMARVGLLVYGYGKLKNLLPAMSIYAKIINILKVKKGEFIGYGNKHKAKKDMTLAVVDAGYFDGIPRLYEKHGYFLINGQRAKIVADICMNMTIVDITNIKTQVGNHVTILGKSKTAEITAQDIAKKCKTIPYEILTNFDGVKLTKTKPPT